jgi:outer membrane protein assembly factor BamE (lipoprotein component of BamABCDE complex)
MTMKPFRTLCISALLATSLAAPAFAEKVDDPSLYTTEAVKKNLVLGKTTREEVRAIYGEPTYVYKTSAKNGGYENRWRYNPGESHGEKARKTVTGVFRSMLPGAYTGAAVNEAQKHGVGARNVKDYSLSIEFDSKGVVTDYDQSESNESKNAL